MHWSQNTGLWNDVRTTGQFGTVRNNGLYCFTNTYRSIEWCPTNLSMERCQKHSYILGLETLGDGIIIIIKVFVKRKTLSIETILSARARTHTRNRVRNSGPCSNPR